MDATATTPALEIRMTPHKGRGLFAAERIPRGSFLVQMKGTLCNTADLPADGMAMQIGDDLWLHSAGDLVDDCGNHSCDPTAGFLTGEPTLFALRDIEPGEEITWDYSTSICVDDWSLTCFCGSESCRGVVRSWHELPPQERQRLRAIALHYLRGK